ncbi:MAG: RsmB/NOP family class I SAM-dependent RNA methyltransferase [Fimbriimonadaceae bacterium]|nr:RsmB/NOP family class I SAM-dependent RNA methyltransferase [Fimbriimonadaceae bacterium]
MPTLEPLSWQPATVARFVDGFSVGQDPQHQQGLLYSLDLSSVFSSVAFTEIPTGVSVLDLCSAPGGKAILAQRALDPKVLCCNEVIAKRIPALRSNLERLKIQADISNLDPKVWAQGSDSFDLVIVDAPCSGQSLIARGKDAFGCFLPHIVKTNANRQRRILACAAECVNEGGWLAYMTCTFGPEENEDTVAWLLKRFPSFTPQKITLLTDTQSQLVDWPCYRLFPHLGVGAGAFVCLLRQEM